MPDIFDEISIETQTPEEDIFDQISLTEEKRIPRMLKEGVRHLGRAGARVSETVLGAPRAFGEFLEQIVPEKMLVKGAKYLGLEKPAEKALEITKKYAPYKLFPTSEQVREDITKNLFGKKLEPQTPAENLSDEIVSDIAALAIPIGGEFKILRPVLTALGANTAAELGEKFFDLGEKGKAYTKIGTMLLSSLARPKQLNKFKNNLYKSAEELVPAGAETEISLKKLEQLEKNIRKGGTAPSKTAALKKIDEIRKISAEGKIPVAESSAFKRSINEELAGLYKQLEGNKPGIRAAKRHLGDVAGIVDDALKNYGDINPEWEAFYRPANEVHGAIEQSKRARNFIGKHYKKMATPTALGLFGIEQLVGIPKTLATVAVSAPVLKSGEIVARVWKSPVLRKYYLNVIKNAVKEDAVAMRENLKKLDAALEKED